MQWVEINADGCGYGFEHSCGCAAGDGHAGGGAPAERKGDDHARVMLVWVRLQHEDISHAPQAMATLGAVPHLVRLLESANEVIAEGASECLLHIVAPSDGHPAVHPSQLALRSAGAIPSLLSVVRLQSSSVLPELQSRASSIQQSSGTTFLPDCSLGASTPLAPAVCLCLL